MYTYVPHSIFLAIPGESTWWGSITEMIMYFFIIVSLGYLVYCVLEKKLPWTFVLPFVVHAIFNLAFTPARYGLNNEYVVSVVLLLACATLYWGLSLLWNHAAEYRWLVYVNFLYILLVIMMTALHFSMLLLG